MKDKIEKLLSLTETAPSLGPERRSGTLAVANLEQRLAEVFGRVDPHDTRQQLIRAIVLLWHDHLNDSHSISQCIPTADGSYVHGIMHRREPDYSNAKYWFRRVGGHPIFDKLAAAAGQKSWDAFDFVDAVERARGNSQEEQRLRSLQAVEMKLLLEHVLE